jgi:hypothetical protein
MIKELHMKYLFILFFLVNIGCKNKKKEEKTYKVKKNLIKSRKTSKIKEKSKISTDKTKTKNKSIILIDKFVLPVIFDPLKNRKTESGCEVIVEKLVDAQNFRGPGPRTQSLRDSFKRNPQYMKIYRRKSHGDRHLRCTYVLKINAKKYKYEYNINNLFRKHTKKRCSEKIPKLLKHIFSITKKCKDLKSGEYYGFFFKPVKMKAK